MIRRSEFQTLGHSAEIGRGLPSLGLASSFGRRVIVVFNAMGAGAFCSLEHGASTSASIPKWLSKILIDVGTILFMKTQQFATGVEGSYFSKNCLHCGAVAARSMMRLPLQSPVGKPTVGSRLSAILLPATRNNQKVRSGFGVSRLSSAFSII